MIAWTIRIVTLALIIGAAAYGINAHNENLSEGRRHFIEEECNRRIEQGAFTDEFALATDAVTEHCLTK